MARDRILAGAIAMAAWSGLAIQFVLLWASFAATGDGPLAGIWRFFAYFTILTNILVAFATTGWLIQRRPSARVMAMIAVSIAVVGAIYVIVLRPLWDPQGWQLAADVLLHYVTPVAFVAFWLGVAPARTLAWRDAAWMLIYPMGYLVYALARGAVDGFYPYPFIDLPKIGPTQLALNSAGLVALFGVLSLGAVAIKRR